MVAAEYRDEIADLIRKYGDSPGGAPPVPVVESIIHVESGGDPAARSTHNRRGLALIGPDDPAWGMYLDSPLVNTYGTDPDILHTPAASIEILALELNQRQEEGLAARAAGKPSALEDWWVTALSHEEYTDNSGLITTDPYAATAYYGDLIAYADAQFGHDATERIDAENPGALIAPGDGEPIIYDPQKDVGADTIHEPDMPSLNPLSGLKGALSTLTKRAGVFAMRAGLYVVGALLAILGLWLVFRNREGKA